MTKRFSSIVLIIAILFCALIYEVSFSYAEENRELDIIMVLDKSGSMIQNDENGMMKEAVNMLVGMMPAKTSRVGIIAFNLERTVVARLTPLGDYSTVDSIIKNVDSVSYEGDTDIGNAVADAMDMFDLNDDRTHVILVFSDGRNDFGTKKNQEAKSDERLNDALAKAKTGACEIYCLGFGEEMSNIDDTPYKKLATIASSAETISTETNPVKIHRFFVEMLARLIGAIEKDYEDSIPIEPNVKEANIYISSEERLDDISITLTAPDGTNVDLNNKDVGWFFKQPHSVVIKLFTPPPGDYMITTSKENLNITVGYVPSYEYLLKSRITDSSGNDITQIDNGMDVLVHTVITQNNNNITDKEIYDTVVGEAIVKAQDKEGEDGQKLELNYDNGELVGKIRLDRVAKYSVDINVKAESFEIHDKLSIETTRRGISFNNPVLGIEKKVLDKTFKKSVELLVPNDELLGVITDPDNVGFSVVGVQSSDEERVTAQMTSDGLLLTGLKRGSSLVTATYKDGLGNNLETSFNVVVKDKLVYLFYAMIPVLIGLIALIIVLIMVRKSRMLRGVLYIRNAVIKLNDGRTEYLSESQDYDAGKSAMALKLFIEQYAYYVNSDNRVGKILYSLIYENDEQIKDNLNAVKLVGTFMANNGCTLEAKKGNKVKVDQGDYGQAIKRRITSSNDASKEFIITTCDSSGNEVSFDCKFEPKRSKAKKAKKAKSTMQTGGFDSTDDNDTFNDFDF